MRGEIERGRSFDSRSGGRGGLSRGRGRSLGGRGRGVGGGRGLSFSSRPRSAEGFSRDRPERRDGFSPRGRGDRPDRRDGFAPRGRGDRIDRRGGFVPRGRGDRMDRRDGFTPRGRGGFSGRRSPGPRRGSPPGRRSPGPRRGSSPLMQRSTSIQRSPLRVTALQRSPIPRSAPMQRSAPERSVQNRRPSPVSMLRYSPPPRRMSPPPRRQYSPPPQRRDFGGPPLAPRDRYSEPQYPSNGAARDSGPMRFSRDDLPPRVRRDSFGVSGMNSSWNERGRSPPAAPRYRSRSPIARRRSPPPAYGGSSRGRGRGRGRDAGGDFISRPKEYAPRRTSADFSSPRDRVGGGPDYPVPRERSFAPQGGTDFRGPKQREFVPSRDRGFPPRDRSERSDVSGPRDRTEFSGGRSERRSEYRSYLSPSAPSSYEGGRVPRSQRQYSPRGGRY